MPDSLCIASFFCSLESMKLDDIYKGIPLDKIPWNRTIPPSLLSDCIENYTVIPDHILDCGCGLGHYSAYYSQKGYQITGIDSSEISIKHAKTLFESNHLKGDFFNQDLCGELKLPKLEVDFAFDYEVLHHIYPEQRDFYLRNVKSLLKKDAYYLSICFSEEDVNFGTKGKYRTTPIGTRLYFSSISEIKELMEKHFTIIELKQIELPGKPIPHQAIFCLMRKL